MQPILLLDNDREVIDDITHSLKLVSIPLIVAESIAEAKATLVETTPCLIICRYSINGDTQIASLLAHDLENHPQFKKLPRALLLSVEERKSVDTQGLFHEFLELPVVFPLFTKKIQDLLAKLVLSARSERKALSPQPASKHQSTQTHSTQPHGTQSHNLSLLAALQNEVMNLLGNDKKFSTMSGEQALLRIIEATQSVGKSYLEKDE